MWSSLILLLFVIFAVTDQTNAYGQQHGNHSFNQPRKTSYTVNLASRELTEATIRTPRYPWKYPAINQVVEWTIKTIVPIKLFCPVFKLQPRRNYGNLCIDYLGIYGGFPFSNKYCGDALNNKTLTINPLNGEVSFIFKSAKRPRRFKGFECIITSIQEECQCGVYTPPIASTHVAVDPNTLCLAQVVGENRTRVDTPAVVPYIVGGTQASDNQYPWQAVMVWTNTNLPKCGGSLINDRYVLTAAHCLDDVYAPSEIQILLGVHCWSNTSPEKLRLDVIKIIQHTGYNNPTFLDNDIALLKLEDCIDFVYTQFRPVCLPISNTDPIPVEDDVETAISGFGTLAYGGDRPDCLQHARVPTMTNKLCQRLYHNATITNNMICAGFPGVGGIDSCQGDSGGPMATTSTSNNLVDYFVQIGVVSWGYGCADPKFPGVYARVSSYIGWINDNTEGSTTCPPP